MRGSTLVALALIAVAGCAEIEALFKPSPKAPAPQAPAPSPPKPAPSSSSPPPLRPELPAGDEQRLMDDARRKIAEVERVLRALEGRAMKPQQQEMFLTAKNFLDQARIAMGERDYQRAANLASKARTLSDDLAAGTK